MAIWRTCFVNMTLALGAAVACAAGARCADAAETLPRIISLSPHTTERLGVGGAGRPGSRKAELEGVKLRLYVTDQHHLDDIGATLIEFGRLAGTLPVAAAAARRYQIELAQLRSRYAARSRLRVFYQVWDRPLYTLSGAHVVSEGLSMCGGGNVFDDASALAPEIDKEAVLARNPDVILIAAAGAEGVRQTL